MSIASEVNRLAWGLRTARDFAVPRPAIFGSFATNNLGDLAALAGLQRFFVEKIFPIDAQTYRVIPANLRFLICGAAGCINPAPAGHVLKYLKRIPHRTFPCFMISAGLNRDYGDEDFYFQEGLFKDFLAEFDFLSVRDRLSQRFLEKLGFDRAVIIPDMVLTLPRPFPGAARKLPGKEKVGLVLSSNNKTFQKQRGEIFRLLVGMCEDVIKSGREVLCIPFQVDQGSPSGKRHSEVLLAREIRRQMPHPERFLVLDKMQNPADTLNLIGQELHYMISMRLHGNVFSARAGVPFISLSYNEKQDGFLEMMSAEDRQIALKPGGLDRTRLRILLDQMERRHSEIAANIRQRADELEALAIDGLKRMRQEHPVLRDRLKFD